MVQELAVSAEESAGASEEMYAQTEQMKKSVKDMVILVNGTGAHA